MLFKTASVFLHDTIISGSRDSLDLTQLIQILQSQIITCTRYIDNILMRDVEMKSHR